jgi:hypothetical protein
MSSLSFFLIVISILTILFFRLKIIIFTNRNLFFSINKYIFNLIITIILLISFIFWIPNKENRQKHKTNLKSKIMNKNKVGQGINNLFQRSRNVQDNLPNPYFDIDTYW